MVNNAPTARQPLHANRPGGDGPPRLLDRIREQLRLRRYAFRTEQAYVHWICRFIRFHQTRHPAEMGKDEVTAFLTALAVQRKVAASTQNQALGVAIGHFSAACVVCTMCIY